MKQDNTVFDHVLKAAPEQFIQDWLDEISRDGNSGSVGAGAAKNDVRELFDAIQSAVAADADLGDIAGAPWVRTRSVLAALSQSRAAQGLTAAQTSSFVLAIKRPLFVLLESQLAGNSKFTITTYQRSREEVIARQQQELLELSTPVVKLWDGVLAVPMIGTLDSSRTQLVMETLLTRIVETGSELAIIDITGVPTVDTLVAQHLLKTVTAIRLMGADAIISGIRPQIAQTIVHLGIDLQGITTKASLADALRLAMKKTGHTVTREKN
jgi:rsbT co-antagonist protein RsbR